MLDLILIIVFLLSLAAILFITIKKFPALASLDVNSIPAEREAQKKQEIVSSRLKRSIADRLGLVLRFLQPMLTAINNFFKWVYERLHQLRDQHRQEKNIAPEELEKRVDDLIENAEQLTKQEDYQEAERRLIEAIGMDSKNIEAFRSLANLYFERRDYEEAKQTYEHVLKLNENDEGAYENLAEIASADGDLDAAKKDYRELIRINSHKSETYYQLALVCEANRDFHESLDNIKEALNIDQNNPRYLDMWLRISIIIKDKVNALEAFERLQEANPENQKLEELKAEVDQL